MEQDDIPVLHVFQHSPLHRRRVGGRPVPGVYRPAEDCQLPRLGHLPNGIAAAASRRPEKHRLAPLGQQRLHVHDFGRHRAAAHFLHVFVGVAVVADLVTLVENPLGDVRVILDPVAAQQKRGLHLPLPQSVQKPAGIPPGRPVVKGQRHIFCRFRRVYGNHEQTQHRKNRQKPPHHTTSVIFYVPSQRPHIRNFDLT